MSLTGERLTVAGTFNLRDVGGIRASDGRVLRSGSLYRSGDLGRLTPAGAERLAELGVGLVIDLRTPSEVERRGRYPFERHGIAYRHEPLLDSQPADPGSLPPELPPDLAYQVLLRIATTGGERLGAVLNVLAAEPAVPALVHCIAGKDRTGVVVALVLSLLEVADGEVAADFARSEAEVAALRAGSEDPDLLRWLESVPAQVLEARPATMLAFLAWVRDQHGSPAAFAASIGVAAAAADALRRRLVETPG